MKQNSKFGFTKKFTSLLLLFAMVLFMAGGNMTDTAKAASSFTVYIAGDSTAQSYNSSYYPQQGWGYYLHNYLSSNITVQNRAIAGRSSKSFYDNGRLTTILNEIHAGDYFLVQFGINDSNSSNSERYAPVCGSVTNPTSGSFEYYIKMYVEGALAKGATPVLMSPSLGLKAYSNGTFSNSYTNYGSAMQSIANYYGVPYIDANTLQKNHYNSIGYNAAKLYYLYGVVAGSTDQTHFCEAGANAVAGLIAGAFNNLLNNSSSNNYVIADGWYYIKNQNSQKYLQVTNNTGANAQNVEIGSGSGVAGQRWKVTNLGNGYFTLQNGLGYMLDVNNGVNADNTNIQIYQANGLDPQIFSAVSSSTSGYYGIIAKISNGARGLDVAGKKTADGTNVLLYTYSGKTNQIWKFESTSAPN